MSVASMEGLQQGELHGELGARSIVSRKPGSQGVWVRKLQIFEDSIKVQTARYVRVLEHSYYCSAR